MQQRYEVYPSLKNAGKFNVFNTVEGRFVRIGLPKDSADEEAEKLNALFPPKVA